MHVRVYSKTDCALCDAVIEHVQAHARTVGFDLSVIDVRGDAALFAAYRYRVPVVMADGVVLSELSVDGAALGAALERAKAASGPA